MEIKGPNVMYEYSRSCGNVVIRSMPFNTTATCRAGTTTTGDHHLRFKATYRRVLQIIRGLLITTPWLSYLLVADLLLSILLPVAVLYPSLVYEASSRIAYSVWSIVQYIVTHFNGAEITITGSAIPRGESAIVIANHVAWTGAYLIQELALRAGMLSRCRYFCKHELKWVPFLGTGLWAMGMPLIRRGWTQDQVELNRAFGSIVKYKWPVWMISYCEGTRYTPAKAREAVTWCKATNKPVPQHTLHPRTRGFIATVQELRKAPHIKAVYDCTLAYGNPNEFLNPPTTWQTLSGSDLSMSLKLHLHVQRYPIESLPSSDEGLAEWLEQRWVDKGRVLEDLRDNLARTGSFATVGRKSGTGKTT